MSTGRIPSACMFSLAWIAILPTLLLVSCNSLPPTTPIDPEQKWFDPRQFTWQSFDSSNLLTANWYKNDATYLAANQDTLRIEDKISLEWTTESADSYLRIIYLLDDGYHVIYLDRVAEDSLRFLRADRTVETPERASTATTSGTWQPLTSRVGWEKIELDQAILGNWHIRGDNRELIIGLTQAVIDGETWSLDSLQTDFTYDRMLLSRGDSAIAIYFDAPGPDYLRIIAAGALNANHRDIRGALAGDWEELVRWHDFLEISGWNDGGSFTYAYSLITSETNISNIDVYHNSSNILTSGRDSLTFLHTLRGEMRLSCSGRIEGNGLGALDVEVSFAIDDDRLNQSLHNCYNYTNSISFGRIPLEDSTWTLPSRTVRAIHRLTMENDTLWLEHSGGRDFFCPRKVEAKSQINMRMFIVPREPELPVMPDTLEFIGSLLPPSADKPNPVHFSFDPSVPDQESPTPFLPLMMHHGTGGVYGGVRLGYSQLSLRSGLLSMQYSLGFYERRFYIDLFNPDYPEEPFSHEFFFECELR